MLKVEKLSPVLRLGIIVLALSAALLSLLGRHYYEHSRAVPVVLQTAPIDPRSLFQGDYVTLSYEISRLDSKLFGATPLQIKAGSNIYVALKDAGMVWADMKASFSPLTPSGVSERVVERRVGKDDHWRLRPLFEWSSEQTDRLQGWGSGRELKAAEGTRYYVLQKQIGPVWEPVRAATTPLTAQPGEVVLRGRTQSGAWGESTDVRVTYNIEAFFVPEGEGGWVERLGWGSERNRMLVRVLVAPSGSGYVDNLLFDNREIFQSSGLMR